MQKITVCVAEVTHAALKFYRANWQREDIDSVPV